MKQLLKSTILDASLARDATLAGFPGASRFLKCKQSHSVLPLDKVLLYRFCLPPALNILLPDVIYSGLCGDWHSV